MVNNNLSDFFKDLANTIRVKILFDEGESTNMNVAKMLSKINEIDVLKNGKFKDELICYTAKGLLGIETVTLASAVTEIKADAYKNCTNLNTVNILGPLEKISSKAFEGCTKLTTINLPDTLKFIGSNAFEGCTSLVDLNFSDNLTVVGQQALNSTAWFKSQNGPRVAGRVLCGSVGVEEFVYNEKVLVLVCVGACTNDTILKKAQFNISGELDTQCFQNATALEEIVLNQDEDKDESVDLSTRCFYGCVKLKKVYIDNLNNVSSSAFTGGTSLEEIHIMNKKDTYINTIRSTIQGLVKKGATLYVSKEQYENWLIGLDGTYHEKIIRV